MHRRKTLNFCSRECFYKYNRGKNSIWYGKKRPDVSIRNIGNKYGTYNKDKKRPNLSGDKNPAWKGGICVDKNGYILIHKPLHPYKNSYNYVREHRLVMEKSIGRYLKPIEVVHHRNEIKNDNRIENLMLFSNDLEHRKEHVKIRCR